MQTLTTPRLTVRPLNLEDAPFILKLVNEPTWLQFIGDRGVRNLADAQNYITQGPHAMMARYGFGFCAVVSQALQQPIGMCGLTQRDYLDSPDIGFAFLPQHVGQGYAFEAASAVLANARAELDLQRIYATTRLDNVASQKLLEKLGFQFLRLVPHPDGDRMLKLYELEIGEKVPLAPILTA